VRWVRSGRWLFKVPDIHDVGLMEETRADLPHLAQALRIGCITGWFSEGSGDHSAENKRPAAWTQNAGDPL